MPQEYRSTDMVIWKHFTDLLTLMITEHMRIFEPVDRLKQDEFDLRQQAQATRMMLQNAGKGGVESTEGGESKKTPSEYYQDALDHIEHYDGTPEVQMYKVEEGEEGVTAAKEDSKGSEEESSKAQTSSNTKKVTMPAVID